MKAKRFIPIVLLLLASCTGRVEQKEQNVDYTDDYGRTVSVPTSPKRVVSLSPAVTEILYAIGAEDMLVGRTDFCTYPPEAAEIPSIGGISNLNIERIVSKNPDLVISGSMVSKKDVDQMEKLGIPLVSVIEKPHFEALYDNIGKIGGLVQRERESDSLVREIQARYEEVNEGLQSEGKETKVYYVVGYGAGGNFTAGGNTFINDIIQMAGGRNIAEEVEGWSYSMEAIMKEDPDYIIVRREDSATFVNMQPYTTLRAVKEGHVVGIESGMLDLQVPRNIDAVLYLRKRLQGGSINAH